MNKDPDKPALQPHDFFPSLADDVEEEIMTIEQMAAVLGAVPTKKPE